MSVQYRSNGVSVSNNVKQNEIVFAHPNDQVHFDFDISGLHKEVINGDLVIRLLNGKTITIVNFNIMVLDNNAPVITDSTKTYNPFELFTGTAYFEQDVPRYVISRQVSTPDPVSPSEGDNYPTAKEIFEGTSVSDKNIGSTPVDTDNPVFDFSPFAHDYVTKTFQKVSNKNYDPTVPYTSRNKYLYNNKDVDLYPIKLLLINPRLTPEYGTDYQQITNTTTHPGYDDLFISLGGGRLRGDEYAHYMYKPQTIDLSKEQNKLWFDGRTQGDKIVRYIHIGVPTSTVTFTKVFIGGLPAGIEAFAPKNSNLEVKPLGSGSFTITVKGAAAGGVEIPIRYKIGYGNGQEILAPITISYEGTQGKTGNLVKGDTLSYLHFKPVYSADDIENFNTFNTSTFSTRRDPLIIIFGGGDDVIKGWEGDYTYISASGANRAYGGKANEIFHLGGGKNKYYVGIGNATVDTAVEAAVSTVANTTVREGDNINENSVYLGDVIELVGINNTNAVIDNGMFIFTGSYQNKNFKTTVQGFTRIFFEVGDNENSTVSRDNTVTLNTTLGLPESITLYMGGGRNVVKAGNNAIVVDFVKNERHKDNPELVQAYITTQHSANGVFVDWGGTQNQILGSDYNDTIIGYADNPSISFDGRGGYNTANYSDNRVTKLVYDASTGLVVKENGSTDTVVGINKFIVSQDSASIFYGALYYTGFDGNEHQANITYSAGAASKLSYERLRSENEDDERNNGVDVDLIAKQVTKRQTGGVDTFEGGLINIIASNNNDKFTIANDNKSNRLDGLGGFNTIDYSNLSVSILVSLTSGSSGIVSKSSGANGIDMIANFRHFIGSRSGSTFALNAYKFGTDANPDKYPYRFIVEGSGSPESNRVTYSYAQRKAVVLDFNPQGDHTATLYSGKNDGTSVIGKDKLVNIRTFELTDYANNIVYMYNADQLNYTIAAGNGSKNLLSFERSHEAVSLNFNDRVYDNLTGFANVKLSTHNDTVVMGDGVFAQNIDGNGGTNTVDFSALISPIVGDIDLEEIALNQVNVGNKYVNIRNFSRILATLADDIFNIKFDLANINSIKDKQIFLDGRDGFNKIDFSNVSDRDDSSAGLIIDLSGDVELKITDKHNNQLLNLVNFTTIIGSKGDDIFILPNVLSNFNIDGGAGFNTVSYQTYKKGVYITEDTLSKFKNIQKIIGSQGDDVVLLSATTELNIDGYHGFNAAHYAGNFDNATTVNISYDIMRVVKGDKTDVLNHLEWINFTNTTHSQALTFNVTTLDNSSIANNKNIFLAGGKDSTQKYNSIVNYNSLEEGVVLNLDVTTGLPAQGQWYYVDKGNNNRDYLQNITEINLSQNSRVNIYNSIVGLSGVPSLSINAGGSGILSFSRYVGDVNIDVTKTSMQFTPTFQINLLGFNTFEGVNAIGFHSTFISAADQNYKFDGLQSESTISYERLDAALEILIQKVDRGYDSLEIRKGSTTDTANNIKHLKGGAGKMSITIRDNIEQSLYFEAREGTNSSINYENVNNDGKLVVFNISGEGTRVIRGLGLFTDTLINIYDITGTQDNNRFEIEQSAVQGTGTYTLNGGGGKNTIIFSNVRNDIIFSMPGESATINVNVGSRQFAQISNMETIFGSAVNKNTFILGNLFNLIAANQDVKLRSIYGNTNANSTDVLDLRDSRQGLSLDPVSGRIHLASAPDSRAVTDFLSVVSGIHTILLSDADDQVDVSSGGSIAGWKVIDGGGGQNNVSFNKILSGIVYDISAKGSNFNFTLINFTGVTGSQGNDVFFLTSENATAPGIRIDGNKGTSNTIDFSDLNVNVTVNVPAGWVSRGDIRDTVSNIQVFKGGKARNEFIGVAQGNYHFTAPEGSANQTILDYSNVNVDLIFNFGSNSVVKGSSDLDLYSNVTYFKGGSGNNMFFFTADGFAKNITNITLDGGSGKSNVLSLIQLSVGVVFDISSNLITLNENNRTLNLRLVNIGQVIGSKFSDTFKFSDSVNGFIANGGVNESGHKDIADLSSVSSGIKVDFSTNTITFGSNSNYFLNITSFIGSRAGGNQFLNLTSGIAYDINGNSLDARTPNLVDYGGSSTRLRVFVKDNHLIIDKGSAISDNLSNIQVLNLSRFSDELILNDANDLQYLRAFQKIDGSGGDNLVTINTSGTVIDLLQGFIQLGDVRQNLDLANFNSWNFTKNGVNFIAGSSGFDVKLIQFAEINESNKIDFTNIKNDLAFVVDKDGKHTVVSNVSLGVRGNLINASTILLGNQTYNISYEQFNLGQSVQAPHFRLGSSAKLNLEIYNCVAAGSSSDNITIQNNTWQFGTQTFNSVNNVTIRSLDTTQFTDKPFIVHIKDIADGTSNLSIKNKNNSKNNSFQYQLQLPYPSGDTLTQVIIKDHEVFTIDKNGSNSNVLNIAHTIVSGSGACLDITNQSNPVNIVVNVLDGPLSSIEGGNHVGGLDFSNLAYSSTGLAVSIKGDTIKIENSSLQNITLSGNNPLKIVGSASNDTYHVYGSLTHSLDITENGASANINSVVLHRDFSQILHITPTGLYIDGEAAGIRSRGAVGLNRIVLDGGILAATANINISPTLRYLEQTIQGGSNSTGQYNVVLGGEHARNTVTTYINLSYQDQKNRASGSVSYSDGRFEFSNLSLGNSGLSYLMSVSLDNAQAKDDYFNIVSKDFVDHLGDFKTTEVISLGYALGGGATAGDFFKVVNATANFSDTDFKGYGFKLKIDESMSNEIRIDYAKGKHKIIALPGVKNILLNRTSAIGNDPLDTAVIDIEPVRSLAFLHNAKFSFGDLNTMKLPQYYRILNDGKGNDYPTSSKYPAWNKPNNIGGPYDNVDEKASYKNRISAYDTYKNVFRFEPNIGEIYGKLLLNSNNESLFSSDVNFSSTITVSGANLFWLGQSNNNKSSTPITIYVNELSRAKPFSLMLGKNPNPAVTREVDCSQVRDGEHYVFRYLYNQTARDSQQVIAITNLPKVPGKLETDSDDLKVYGNLAGVNKLILPESQSTIYFQFSDDMQANEKLIVGQHALTTFSLTPHLASEHIFVIGKKIERPKNKVSTNTNSAQQDIPQQDTNPEDATRAKQPPPSFEDLEKERGENLQNNFNVNPDSIIRYHTNHRDLGQALNLQNVKIIESGYQREYKGITIHLNTKNHMDAKFEHNFVVRTPFLLKDMSSEVFKKHSIKIIDEQYYQVTNKIVMAAFMNDRYMLFADKEGFADPIGNCNTTVSAEDFAVNYVKTRGIAVTLGLNLDFSNMPVYKGQKGSYTVTFDTVPINGAISSAIFAPPKKAIQYTYEQLGGDRKDFGIYQEVNGVKRGLVLHFNGKYGLNTKTAFDGQVFSSNPVGSDALRSEEEWLTDLPAKEMSDEQLYYEHIAVHGSELALIDKNNVYRTFYNANQNGKAVGINSSPNETEYKANLSNPPITTGFWDQLSQMTFSSIMNATKKGFEDDIDENETEVNDSAVTRVYRDVSSVDSNNEGNAADVNANLDVMGQPQLANAEGSDDNHMDNTIISQDHTDLNDDSNIGVNGNHSTTNDFNLLDVLLNAPSYINKHIEDLDQEGVLHDLSVDSIPREVMETTYLQDEANSISYTLDGNSISDWHGDSELTTVTITTQEQHKNKYN